MVVWRLKEFNLTLLGKWCWRMLEDLNSLWSTVLWARYGQDGGRLSVERGDGSVWWKTMRIIREEVGHVEGGWLRDNISRKMGDGNSTLFWVDLWLDRMPLNKLATVMDMFSMGWGSMERHGSGVGGCSLGRKSW